MASAGAKCNHLKHVTTQLPNALCVAAISFIMYIIVSLVRNPVICLLIGIALTIGALIIIRQLTKNQKIAQHE